MKVPKSARKGKGKKGEEAAKPSKRIRVQVEFTVYADEGFERLEVALPHTVERAISEIGRAILNNKNGGWCDGRWKFRFAREKR